MDGTVVKNSLLAGLAVVGTAVAEGLGGFDAALEVLVALMVADYVTGILVAGFWQNSTKTECGGLSSQVCFQGLIKKMMVLLLVYIGVQLDEATGNDYIRTAVIFFFIGNEGISLLENFALMGVPFPSFIQNALEALQEQGNQGEDQSE